MMFLRQKGSVIVKLIQEKLTQIKNLKLISLRSILVILSTLIILSVVSFTLFGFVVAKDITLIDNNKEKVVTTTRLYVEELLAEQGITLQVGDRISTSLDSLLYHDQTITIQRGKKITLQIDGGVRNIFSCKTLLGDALRENDVLLGEHDEVSVALDTPVTEGMHVTVVRVRVYEETRNEIVPSQDIVKPNPDKLPGYEVLISEGMDGSSIVTYQVVEKDGAIVERTKVNEVVQKPVVHRVVERGVQGVKTVAASTSELQVARVIECNASAYNASVECNGVYAGLTATGRKPNYGVVAVDPRVIPLGSKLYIEAMDGSWTYGYAVAGDTGGAIKGNKIDLFFHTKAECRQFGRRQARVYVLAD